MAINLLRLARFVDGERPSAEKFNKLFSYIENKLSGLNSAIGDSINNGVTSIVDTNDQTFDIKINNIWGVSKFLAENVINSRTRYADIFSLVKSIGSMSNLNPLTLGGESIIKEVIPAGINEYVFKYPVLIQDPIKSSLTFLTDPVWLNQQTGFVEENGQMLEPGQWKLWKFFEIDGEDNTTISYAKSMVWYTTSTTPVEITYKTNSENWGGGANYQGSSFNVIPDFNTPKTALNSEDEDGFFYNLKFTNNNTTYTTVELPYVLYQQTALSRNELDTALLSEADINHKKRLTLPKYLKDYQLTLAQPTEFPLPKGFLTLVDFSEDTFTILDDLNYIYVDEHTFKVNISSSILNCVTADPNSSTYKQLFLLVNGTDITRSINDLQIKQNKHSHDGSFGESLIHIKDITGIFEKTDRNVYFPSARGGHIASQYLHRDGYRYNSDPQNYDNAIMGDVLLKGNNFNSSFKLFFGEEVPFLQSNSTGQALLPGYLLLTSNLKFSWIGLSSNFLQSETDISFNIQGSENSHVSIISNRDLNIASKDKIVSIIKNVNTLSESGKILDSSYDWNNLKNESSAQIQTENLNASINQTQISLYNNNNSLDLFNLDNSSPTVSLISENKEIPYSELPDQTGRAVGLNSITLISESNNSVENEIKVFTQGTQTSLFQKKEEYLSDKRDSASKDYFKKEIPSYKKEYKKTPDYNFNEQNGAFENTKVLEINNATEKKEGCFVYVIQHLVDDRKDPDFKIYSFKVQALNYNYFTEISSMISKKHIYNKTYDLVRYSKIQNKESIYDTYTKKNLETSFLPNISGDLMFVNNNTGYLSTALYDSNDNEIENRFLIFNQMDGQTYEKKYNFSSQNVSPITDHPNFFNQSKIKRWYKHNPFPCSKEYVNQHFYIYAYAIDDTPYSISINNEPLKHNLFRFTSDFTGNSNDPSVIEDLNYYSSLSKSRVLTKVIWKKFWLKENVNSSSFDFEELLLSGENKFNNSKYILVNQGYLIDCAIPPSKDHSIKTYNWDLSGDFASKARDNNYKRICEFYEVDKTSEFYNLYPDWIAGQTFEPVVSFEPSTNSNLNALNATIIGGLPFTRHGNLQSSNDYEDFFKYFKKHEFEDDNVILYFGKGFVHFNEIVDRNADNFKFDIVIDNDWTVSSIDDIFFDRTLNIKLKEPNSFERNYKSKQDIKIVFSDFNAENLSLINKILPENQKIHSSLINSYPSVIDYLYNLYGYVTNDEDVLLRIFKDSSDYKLFNRFVWQRTVLGEYLNLKESFQNTDFINNKKFTEFFESRIFPSSYANVVFDANLFNSTSSSKPRTFFTFINIEFEKEQTDTENFSRKLNNQINLKTNESADHFVNCRNLLLKTKATFDWVYESDSADGFVRSRNNGSCFNIGPIQGFYNIEIEKFTNNEKSWWSITDQFLLNEKFGCSLFNIKVNTDFNYCLIV